MRSSVAEALVHLDNQPGSLFSKIMEHGRMSVEIYRPVGTDNQAPHLQDELYVIISGSGNFINDSKRVAFQQGDVLFVRAGTMHRFENFTETLLPGLYFTDLMVENGRIKSVLISL